MKIAFKICSTTLNRIAITLDSQERRKIDELNHQFSWNVPYAVQVHEGAVLKSGTELPARPWTREAIARTDLTKVFVEAFNGANQS
ncbi:MAG: hypothetical protein WBB28_27240 [Crinalium sp.]